MLNFPLLHPPLLATLSALGHGGRLLLADANFPLLTAANPAAEIVYLNLKPGMVTIPDVLEPLRHAVPLEAATLMASPDGSAVAAHDDYRALLGDRVEVEVVDRWTFYERTRHHDVALVVATGEERLCANLILTIGV